MRKICIKNNKYIDCASDICERCNENENFIMLDDALAPIIPILWDKGYATTDSCSGHVPVYPDENEMNDSYIRFNANKSDINKIINAIRSVTNTATIDISLYSQDINYLDIRLAHDNNYNIWLENLNIFYQFAYAIEDNGNKETKNKIEMINSISKDNLLFLYEGQNNSGFQKLIKTEDGGIYYSTISKGGYNPTFMGESITHNQLTYDKFIDEIYHHNDHELI